MACKVFDGLFIGDAESSQDSEFIELNKISCKYEEWVRIFVQSGHMHIKLTTANSRRGGGHGWVWDGWGGRHGGLVGKDPTFQLRQ